MSDANNQQPDIEGAIGLLTSPDPQMRQFVAYLLGQARDPRAIEPLIDALQDEHVGVRGAAANALGNIGDSAAVPYLIPLLRHTNPQLMVWAAFALTKLGRDSFSTLETTLQSEDVDVRRSTILAFQQLGDQRAVPLLLALSNDESRRFSGDTTLGEAAIRALLQLGYNIGNLPPTA
ncbi:MAG: HEAT repeat domain-containing protein [Anaerolineae bacterium]|nr:HEAT repeat domain-containing protein [Anaerolineae bacterium]